MASSFPITQDSALSWRRSRRESRLSIKSPRSSFRMDKGELFLHPVNRAEVPDYFEVVHQAMCWLWIDEKLESNSYRSTEELKVRFFLFASSVESTAD